MKSPTLAALKVERRSIAAAIFAADQLDYTQVRQLSSDASKSQASAAGFVSWLIDMFRVESVVLEQVPPNGEPRRAVLSKAALEVCGRQSIPVFTVSKRELLAAYGVPQLRTRKELRAVVTSIWPILGSGHDDGVIDAVALGLFLQVERLFNS